MEEPIPPTLTCLSKFESGGWRAELWSAPGCRAEGDLLLFSPDGRHATGCWSVSSGSSDSMGDTSTVNLDDDGFLPAEVHNSACESFLGPTRADSYSMR
jgi:hypothetical protein